MMPQQFATSNPFSAPMQSQGYQNPGHNSFGTSNMGPAAMPGLGGPSWENEKKSDTKDNVKEFKDLFSFAEAKLDKIAQKKDKSDYEYNPLGGAAAPHTNAFAQPAPQTDAFAQPAPQNDMFAQPAPQNDMFAQPAP